MKFDARAWLDSLSKALKKTGGTPAANTAASGSAWLSVHQQTRQAWLKEQDRRRFLFSAAVALGAYLLLFLIVLIAGILNPADYTNISGPVIIRLGRPDGAEASPRPETPAIPEAPAPSEPAPTPQPEAVAPPVPTPPPSPQPAPQPAATTPPRPAAPAVTPSPPTAVSPPVTQPAPTPAPVAPVPPQPRRIASGSEAGNSYDVTVMGGEGTVRASGLIPLYLFMPLPFELPDSLYQSIPDKFGLAGTAAERKADFARVYEKTAGGTWRLLGYRQPAYEQRILVWPMLEDAGYDLQRAEYKDGKNLRPVEIRFTIMPNSQGSVLADISLARSSGYSDIDEAILAGLRHPLTKFSNDSESKVSGTYTYRF